MRHTGMRRGLTAVALAGLVVFVTVTGTASAAGVAWGGYAEASTRVVSGGGESSHRAVACPNNMQRPTGLQRPVAATGDTGVKCDDILMLVFDRNDQCQAAGNEIGKGPAVVGWWCVQNVNGDWELHVIVCRYVNGQDKAETWINGNSRLMLEVFHSSLADGAAVDQYPWNNTDTQRWLRVRTPDGYYEVVNVNSGKCVGVNGASPLWGASVIQWTCNGNTDQQWGYRFTGRYINARPVYNLVNRHSGLCLDVPYSSLVAGTALQQWACNRTGAQDWF